MNWQKNITLAPFTTYKIGGPADYFITVHTKEELVSTIKKVQERNMPFFLLGTGANILIGDKGFRGLVIKNESNSIQVNETRVQAGSGVSIKELLEKTIDLSLSGFEHFAGIPSSVGGALWQNLHFLSPDRTRTIFIAEILESATIIDEHCTIQSVNRDFFEFDYDYSILHKRRIIVLDATFVLSKKNKGEITTQASENLKWRSKKHPSLPSCGSVFKKIEGVGAGRLIEQAGLKGFQLGGVQVSEKHANFLVNTGTGTARDVRLLITHIQNTVFEKTGYLLEAEISFIGEF